MLQNIYFSNRNKQTKPKLVLCFVICYIGILMNIAAFHVTVVGHMAFTAVRIKNFCSQSACEKWWENLNHIFPRDTAPAEQLTLKWMEILSDSFIQTVGGFFFFIKKWRVFSKQGCDQPSCAEGQNSIDPFLFSDQVKRINTSQATARRREDQGIRLLKAQDQCDRKLCQWRIYN